MSLLSNRRDRLFLLDGTALAYRAFFAFIRNPLINSKGVNTSSVFGFTNTLLKILRDEQPEYIACVFDTRAPTFRHIAYPQYKATREKMPDEMVEQLPLIRKVVEVLRIALLEKEGFEADDVIGTLARAAEKRGLDTYLVSGDKDFMQLVSDRIKMYNLARGGSGSEISIVDSEGVVQKMGVTPDRIIDLLGLMGDSSDNVPGVPGVGPKTALKLLKKFGSMEAVLENADQVEGKHVRENIITHRDQALLSKRLVTIDTEVPLDMGIDDLRIQEMDRDRVIEFFKELEFTRFLLDLPKFEGEKEEEKDRQYTTIRTNEAFLAFLETLKSVPEFAVDLETTSLDAMSAELVGLSFSWKDTEAVYVPVRVPPEEDAPLLDETDEGVLLEKLKPILEDPKIRKCGQNIKYDMLVLARHGVEMRGVDFDSMVAAYLVNPSARQYNIDALAVEYLSLKKIPTTDLIGTGKKQISMAEVPLSTISEYACEDADVAHRLRGILEPMLKKNEMMPLFQDVEIPLILVLMELENNGVALDEKLLARMSGEMSEQLDAIRRDIYEIAGEEFNINSTQQLGKILFEKLKVHETTGLRRPRRTKTGYSTDVRVLESLSVHPLPRRMLDYRQLTKLKSTYVDALPSLMHPVTHRIHASFNQTVAATGRLSTSNPNLQNIPIRTELGREIRKAFVAGKKGWQLLSADYSQIELRVMAHLSGDETLLESFRKGEDVHTRTACEIFGVPETEVTEDHRRQAKTINFGIMYGMGPYGLARRLSISNEEAQNFISAYFSRYPRVNAFIASTIAEAHNKGYVTTLLHRRRYLPELKSSNRNIRDFGERTAINTPIQGTAADLIKVAMIRIARRLREEDWQAMMILQIHDELLFEAPEEEMVPLTEMVTQEMESALALSVPIKVDVGTGENWYDAH